MAVPLCIFLHESRFDRVFQALSLARAAQAMGRPAWLMLFYGALDAYVSGTWDDPASITRQASDEPWAARLARGFEMSEIPSLDELLETLRAGEPPLRVAACSASMQFLGLTAAQVQPKVDRIAGLATMLELADGAQVLYL